MLQESSDCNRPIKNICGIQMISKSLHEQIFKTTPRDEEVSKETVQKVKEHLSSHNLWVRQTSAQENINFKLPALLGNDLPEHFKIIADKQSNSYKQKLLDLVNHSVPEIPEVWNFVPGWTRYEDDGKMSMVEFPDEEAYVFDCEVCVTEGHAPTLATAVSNQYWYSWCSNQLFHQQVFPTYM